MLIYYGIMLQKKTNNELHRGAVIIFSNVFIEYGLPVTVPPVTYLFVTGRICFVTGWKLRIVNLIYVYI